MPLKGMAPHPERRVSRLLIFLSLTFTLDPTLGLTQFNVPQLREMTRQGDTSLDYIMGVVMMNLPQDLLTRIHANLTRGFGPSSGSFPFSFPAPQGQGIDGSSNNNNNNVGTDPRLLNVGDEEPISLEGRRKKRSFGGFEAGNFNSGNLYPGGNFASTGFHNTGSYGDFRKHSGYGGSGSGSGYGNSGGHHTHPGDQNGNLFGGNARSYIEYPGTGYGGRHHGSFPSHGGFGFNKENCPRQADQGFVYYYDNDPLTYPAIEIGNELFVRSQPGSDLLFQAISREIVFPTDPPQIFIDKFLLTANVTCQFTENQIWSYRSRTFTGRCYPLVNFQEVPFYKTCLNRFCKNCGGKSDFFWGHQGATTANVCVTEYETLSLWSYCEELTLNRRIVRDRILASDACTCTTVSCSYSGHYHK